jgi:hypothetical protein
MSTVGVIVHLNLYMEININYTVNSNKIYLYYLLRMRPWYYVQAEGGEPELSRILAGSEGPAQAGR